MKIQIYSLKFLNLTGVYCIENIINNKKYIGSTADSFRMRYNKHCQRLKLGKHINTHLQKSWCKYGGDNFIFYILKILNKSTLKTEMLYIKKFDTFNPDKGYNISVPDKSYITQEVKDKISKTLKEGYMSGRIKSSILGKIRNNIVWNKGKRCKNISLGRRRTAPGVNIYDINKKYITTFNSVIDLIEYSESKLNTLPTILHSLSKDKILRRDKIYKSIHKKVAYKGLYFKTIPYKNKKE